jgi:NADH:ubiquinone oxidoreductase subunit 6 (subunit J)
MEIERGSIPAFIVVFLVIAVGLMGMIMLSAAFETQYSPFVTESLNGNESIFSSDIFNGTQNMAETGTTVITGYIWVFILFAIIIIMAFLYAYLR